MPLTDAIPVLPWLTLFHYLMACGVAGLACCGLWYVLAVVQGRSIRRADVPALVLWAFGFGVGAFAVASLFAPGGPAWEEFGISFLIFWVWTATSGKALIR